MSMQADPQSDAPPSERKRIVKLVALFVGVVVGAAGFGGLLLAIDRGHGAMAGLIVIGVLVMAIVWVLAMVNPATSSFALLPYMLIAGPLKTRKRRVVFPGEIERITELPAEISPQNSGALLDVRA